MKKVIKVISFIIIACLTAAALSACRGASAYEIAVRNGFEGTEEEWLSTLRGKNGLNGADGKDYKGAYDAYDLYRSAVENDGFEGTFGDFISTYFSGTEASSTMTIADCLLQSCTIYASSPISETGSSSYASAGSGVIYSIDKDRGDAYIVTNYHVVYNKSAPTDDHISEYIRAYLYENPYKSGAIVCEYVGGSALYDLAVLKITGLDIIKSSSAKAVTFADSEDLTLGQTVYAIGNSDAEGISVTKGILSVKSEYIELSSEEVGTMDIRVLRYDAAVSPGNSGGGVYDAEGRIVAICNSKTSKADIESMNYGIPSNVIKRIVDRIINYCDGTDAYKIYKPLIGITVSVGSSKTIYNVNKARVDIIEDVVVESVEDNSVVKGQMEVGDKIVSLTYEGITYDVTSLHFVSDFMLKLYEGDQVTLTVLRNGEEINVSFTVVLSMMKFVD